MFQRFEMKKSALVFEDGKSILLCKALGEGKGKLWAKKLPDVRAVSSVLEDEARFYVACDCDDTDGIFIALDRESGRTEWYIPGKSLLHILYRGSLYLIFIDAENRYHLIRAELLRGSKVWHRGVDEDLCEYSFYRDRITLRYRSGKREIVSAETGNLL